MMADIDDIDQALSDAERNLEWLSRRVSGIDARDAIRSSRLTLSDGRKALDRLRQQIRDGRKHVEMPEDFKPTGCMCSWPNTSPPCSWCTEPHDDEEEDATQAAPAAASTKEMSAELKPCPFCNGHDIFIEPDERGSGGQHVAPYHVGCAACKCEQCHDDRDEAIAAWNTRATPAPGAPAGFKLVPIEATEAMKAAAVIYANGNAVYKNVKAEVLRIEESIYGEVFEAMLAAAPGAPGQEAAAVQAVGAPEEMQLCLCEFAKIVPQPNRLYRPIYMPGCKACDHLAGEQIDAYGERSPTYEEIEAAALPPSGAGEKTS